MFPRNGLHGVIYHLQVYKNLWAHKVKRNILSHAITQNSLTPSPSVSNLWTHAHPKKEEFILFLIYFEMRWLTEKQEAATDGTQWRILVLHMCNSEWEEISHTPRDFQAALYKKLNSPVAGWATDLHHSNNPRVAFFKSLTRTFVLFFSFSFFCKTYQNQVTRFIPLLHRLNSMLSVTYILALNAFITFSSKSIRMIHSTMAILHFISSRSKRKQ